MKHYIYNEIDNSTSEIFYIPSAITQLEQQEVLNELNKINDWKQGEAFGKKIARKQKWYDINNLPFCAKWNNTYDRWKSHSYSPWIIDFQKLIIEKIQEYLKINIDFQSMLINRYDDGNSFIPRHQDRSNVNNDFIVSISFGDSRTFLMRRVKYNPENPKSIKLDKSKQNLNKIFTLNSGDILIMAGTCQKWWSHEIPKEKDKSIRYNCTFRNHIKV